MSNEKNTQGETNEKPAETTQEPAKEAPAVEVNVNQGKGDEK